MSSSIVGTNDPEASLRSRTLVLAVCFGALDLFYTYLFYPGVMDWDSASIASMAARGLYYDWVPPVFTFIWKVTDRLGGNPGALWLLQLVIVTGGLYLLALSLLRLGRPGLAAAIAVSAFTPPFAYLFHEMIKDTFMGAAFVGITGLSTYLLVASPGLVWRICAFLAILFLTTLALSARYNAIFGVVPLLMLATYAVFGRKPIRALIAAALSLLILLTAISTFTRYVLHPHWSARLAALISLDIAGITKQISAPASVLADKKEYLESIDRYYTAATWNTLTKTSYRHHVFQSYLTDQRYVISEWIKAIVANPFAYMRHRLAHFFAELRVVCGPCWEMGIPYSEATHNPPDASPRKPALAMVYEYIARGFYWFVRPWVVFVLSLLLAAWSARLVLMRRATDNAAAELIVLAISASAVCYVGAYLIVGLSDKFRYLYWCYQALLLAAIAAAAVVAPPPTPRDLHAS
jgi:hypothetical protein